MTDKYSSAVQTARDYYNSEDADNFYYSIWGGEDIHIGLYQSDEEPIRDASRRTVQHMASRLNGLNEDSSVLDMGAGYGGAARYFAIKFGCEVVALNLSEVENSRDREMNRQKGLGHLINVVDGSFEDLPFEDAAFDVVWSQDAILHSGRRRQVIAEAARVLKPGGEMIFTDPMQADDCPGGVLDPILDRIHLDSLASPAFYRETFTEMGFDELGFEDHTSQLTAHYARVLAELEQREPEISGTVSPEYITRMKKGLQHWVDGGNAGHLAWGIFHFRKT